MSMQSEAKGAAAKSDAGLERYAPVAPRGIRAGACICLLVLMPPAGAAHAQRVSPDAEPPVVTTFLKRIGTRPTGESYQQAVKSTLWDVYPLDDSAKESLVRYLSRSPDNPGISFAAIALIPFHDPSTVRAIVERALDPKVPAGTRRYLLNAAPYVLAIGDAMYLESGELDAATTGFARSILELADAARSFGLGRSHARNLRSVYDNEGTKNPRDRDYGLAIWHHSAYLLGTLDLRDQQTLDVFMTPTDRATFANVMSALSFAANRDFLIDLRNKRAPDVTPQIEARAAELARSWWRTYLEAHPDGDWRPAAREGLAREGYGLEADARSAVSRAALGRAVEAPSEVTRYAAYRILNDAYGTHFDLEPVFMSGKYALSFLDPNGGERAAEAKLRAYWKSRLQ